MLCVTMRTRDGTCPGAVQSSETLNSQGLILKASLDLTKMIPSYLVLPHLATCCIYFLFFKIFIYLAGLGLLCSMGEL